MGTIDIHNYPAFILDYYEGNLAAEEQAALLLFIENHPELRKEFESFELITLPDPETAAFPGKDMLRKPEVTDVNVGEFLIARLEGDLSPAETAALEAFLASHPACRRDERLFAMTRLQPDESVVYPYKHRLKQAVPIGRRPVARYFYYAAAASAVVLLGAFFLLRGGSDRPRLAGKAVGQEQATPPLSGRPAPADAEQETAALAPAHAMPPPALASADPPEKKQAAPAAQHKAPAPVPPTFAAHIPADSAAEEQAPLEVYAAETPAYAANDIAPELIREKLAEEIGNDPAAFSAWQFDAFLDKVTDPDSSLSVDALKEPVFTRTTEPSPAVNEKSRTPVLNALAWGFSKLTDDVALKKKYNEAGDLVAYRFEAGRLKFGGQPGK